MTVLGFCDLIGKSVSICLLLSVLVLLLDLLLQVLVLLFILLLHSLQVSVIAL
jgi:hypothetical protein